MIWTRVLRLVAIAVAAAGVADPVLTWHVAVPQRVSIVLIDDAATAGSSRVSAERVRSNLAAAYDVSVRSHPPPTMAAACPGDGACIVISSGRIPRTMTAGAAVAGAIRVAARAEQLVIERITLPHRVSLQGAASMSIHLRAAGIRDGVRMQVTDENVVVGTRVYRPSADTSVIPVDWIPLAAGPRRLRIRASTVQDLKNAVEADMGVDVTTEPAPVLMYEPQATWLGTFVRRSLSADPRIRLDARTRLAPGLAIAHQPTQALSLSTLGESDTVIVSAPESLNTREIDLLERYVRIRGGSLIVIPDRAPGGPVLRLLPRIMQERRETEPRAVGILRASEFLTFDRLQEGVAVLEATNERPVVVSRALGRGRVIVSGALDAWRFRDRADQFTRFWSALVADAVAAAGSTLNVRLDQSIIAAGDETRVLVEWRSIEEPPADVAATARLTCTNGFSSSVRLWPGGTPGLFEGVVSAMAPDVCAVRASITARGAHTASTGIRVVDEVRMPAGEANALDTVMAAHGAVVVEAGDEEKLVDRVRKMTPPQTQPRDVRPMRSPWWIVPFALSLGGEWWLRRRRGFA